MPVQSTAARERESIDEGRPTVREQLRGALEQELATEAAAARPQGGLIFPDGPSAA